MNSFLKRWIEKVDCVASKWFITYYIIMNYAAECCGAAFCLPLSAFFMIALD